MSERPDLPEPFRVDVHRADGVARIRPVGELDLATVDDLDACLRELTDGGTARIVVDLAALTFMDSTGLRLLLAWDAHSRADGVEISVTQPPAHVERVLSLAGVRERLRFE
jgi:anti-sigma B factor antagonist